MTRGMGGGPKPKPSVLVFTRHFLIGGPGCWEWTARRTKDGYGQWSNGYRTFGTNRAHRISYEMFVGPIPEGLTIDHVCRNRACVRPDHLEAVTNRENLLRGETLAAANIQKTHCLRGHPFDLFNTGARSDGRSCLECKRLNARRRYHQEKKAS